MNSPLLSRALALAVFTLVLSTSHAAPDAQFRPAFQLFNQASAGDTAAVDAAADAFDKLLQAEPASPVLMAYAGASTAMKARTTFLPWKKMGYAEDGLAMLDKALALLTPAHDAIGQHRTPANLETRFVAASTFLAVPEFMHRGARGNALLAEVLASPLLASSPLPFQSAVWMCAGAQAAKENRVADARRFFEQVIQQGAPQAEQARVALQGLPS
jgi:hypothetical protein